MSRALRSYSRSVLGGAGMGPVPVFFEGVGVKNRPQCKDIPDRPILEFLEKLNGKWADWFPIEFDTGTSVLVAMPHGIPEKLALAKMRQMIKRGVVDGCDCGCRGDFVITEKGRAEISQPPDPKADANHPQVSPEPR